MASGWLPLVLRSCILCYEESFSSQLAAQESSVDVTEFVVPMKARYLPETTAMPRTINLLLVEDDELDVINVRRAFRDSSGIGSITVARDGAEALLLLRNGSVPLHRLLVLLD